jgi:PBP1b-binding outer membrane lipoprotein LpoB
MYKYLLASIVLLTGCSTTHETFQQPEQYCYTDQTIVNDNNTVSSKTVLNCTDRPKVHHLNRDIGVAGMCRSYQKPVNRPNGDTIVIRGVMCRDKISGAWVPVNPNLSY